MGQLTTHVLDTATGRPAAGIPIHLASTGRNARHLCTAITNADGRCDAPLLQGAAFQVGTYELIFVVGAHFARHYADLPDTPFLNDIVLRFGIAHADQHYHVPLLVSPYGYSTYRGS